MLLLRREALAAGWWPFVIIIALGQLLVQEVNGGGGSKVEVLTDENFTQKTNEGDWIVDFYAPWCGHCKKLEPVLEELVNKLEPGSGLRVGKLDATVNKKTANEFRIEGYPTVKFKRKGMSFEDYDGPRTVTDFLDFQKKLKGPAVMTASNPKDLFAHLSSNHLVYLLGLPDNAQASDYHHAFQQVADRLRFRASFAMAKGAKGLGSSFRDPPFLAKLEVGEQPVYYPHDVGSSTHEQMASWVTETNYPLVSELHQANFRKLGSMGKLLVVGVVDPSDTTRTSIFLNGLREVGRSQRDLVAQHYVLGYLDGVRWKGFVRQFTIGDDLPRLFVLDMPKGSFYVDPEVDEVDEIETFLVDIVEGKVPVQRQGSMGHATKQIYQQLKDWYPWSTLLIFPVILILSLCFFPSFWAVDEEEDKKEEGEVEGQEGGDEAAAKEGSLGEEEFSNEQLNMIQEESESDIGEESSPKSPTRKKNE